MRINKIKITVESNILERKKEIENEHWTLSKIPAYATTASNEWQANIPYPPAFCHNLLTLIY